MTGSRESLPLVAVGVESIQLTDIRHQRLHRAATSKGATILSPFPSSQVPQAICEGRFSRLYCSRLGQSVPAVLFAIIPKLNGSSSILLCFLDFVTGGTADVVLGGLVTFSGGQQQQSFLGVAYNNGPAAYLFVNGGGGFNGAASTGDTGEILFGAGGATAVSFHAANLAEGAATSFDASGNTLETLSTSVSNLNSNAGDAGEILSFTSVGGQNIARIEVNLPGPAATPNPPYAASIDTFSATVAAAIPEPSSLAFLGLAASCGFLRRRR